MVSTVSGVGGSLYVCVRMLWGQPWIFFFFCGSCSLGLGFCPHIAPPFPHLYFVVFFLFVFPVLWFLLAPKSFSVETVMLMEEGCLCNYWTKKSVCWWFLYYKLKPATVSTRCNPHPQTQPPPLMLLDFLTSSSRLLFYERRGRLFLTLNVQHARGWVTETEVQRTFSGAIVKFESSLILLWFTLSLSLSLSLHAHVYITVTCLYLIWHGSADLNPQCSGGKSPLCTLSPDN